MCQNASGRVQLKGGVLGEVLHSHPCAAEMSARTMGTHSLSAHGLLVKVVPTSVYKSLCCTATVLECLFGEYHSSAAALDQ